MDARLEDLGQTLLEEALLESHEEALDLRLVDKMDFKHWNLSSVQFQNQPDSEFPSGDGCSVHQPIGGNRVLWFLADEMEVGIQVHVVDPQ